MELTDFLISNYSFFGMILAATIANLFPGIPEELFLLTIGYLSINLGINFWLTTMLVFLGLLLADSILYILSKRGTKIITIFLQKIMRGGYSSDHIFLRKHINLIVFGSRFFVHARSLGPISAGIIHYPYKKFIAIDALALAVYTPLILIIGRYFHNKITQITSGIGIFKNSLAIFVVILIIGLGAPRIYRYVMRQIKSAKSNSLDKNNN